MGGRVIVPDLAILRLSGDRRQGKKKGLHGCVS